MLDKLKFVKKVSWPDVFNVWQKNEGADPVWQKFAVEEKGWNSWEEWRRRQIAPLEPAIKDWRLYEIVDPNALIPKFKIGPFPGWQKHFERKNFHTFEDLVNEHFDWSLQNTGIKARKENFPMETQFIGFYVPKEDVVVLFEGHHRAAAIALAVKEGAPIQFEKPPVIALAELTPEEYEVLKSQLDKSSKNPVA